MKRFATLILTTLMALPAMAQEDALKDLPGYVDFGELGNIYGEPKVQINLGGSILNFVSAMSSDSNPESADILHKLKGVRVHVYNTQGDPTAALSQINKVKGMLTKEHWEPIVQVNEDGEQTQIFIKMNGQNMEGLTLMNVDSTEAAFVNIIGVLDPKQLSRVMKKFDVNIDGKLDKELDKNLK